MITIEEVVKNFQRIQNGIPFKKKSKAYRYGDHKSPFKSDDGFEIAEVVRWREGQPLRNISWPLSIRSFPDKIYKIEKIEEKEMPVILVVDISTSILFRVAQNSNKARLLLELMGTLGFTATSIHDPVGLLCYSDRIEMYLKPRANSRYVYFLAKKILEKVDLQKKYPVRRGTDLQMVLKYISKNFVNRRSIILISDFIDVINQEDKLDQDILRKLSGIHDILAIILDDPSEYELKNKLGYLRLSDIETGKIDVVSARKMRRIRQSIEDGQQALIENFKMSGIDSSVFTYGDHFNQLITLFEKRRAR